MQAAERSCVLRGRAEMLPQPPPVSSCLLPAPGCTAAAAPAAAPAPQYEMPEDQLSVESVLALADRTEQEVQVGALACAGMRWHA